MFARISLKLPPYCNIIIVTAITLEIIVYIRLEMKHLNVPIFYTEYLYLPLIKTKENISSIKNVLVSTEYKKINSQ